MRRKEGWSKDNWKTGTARENDETQRGSGQGRMGTKGGERRRGGGRQVSDCTRCITQTSVYQTDRDRQTEYIKYGNRGDYHLHQIRYSQGQRSPESLM